MTDYYRKYLKYKKKYLKLKDINNNQSKLVGSDEISEPIANTGLPSTIESTGDMDTLLSASELYNKYGKSYKFYQLYQKNPKNINTIMDYIYSKFGPFQKRIDAKNIFADKKISDARFYQLLRKDYTDNLDEIFKFQKNLYRTKQVVQKTRSINKVIKRNLPLFQCHNILDIGTEDVNFILELEKNTKCRATGLNIRTGYSHYNTYNEAVQSNKIVLYDGIHIPFQNSEFDLVTIIAVLHHVENVENFIKEVCRVSKNIYIKDNDMVTIVSRNSVDIQHELYEGVLYPSKLSPLYVTSNKQIVQLLESNNFEIIYNELNNYFTRPYIILASKKL